MPHSQSAVAAHEKRELQKPPRPEARFAGALLAQRMAERERMAEIEPADVVGDAHVGTQRVAFVEAEEVQRGGLHQREVEIEWLRGRSGNHRVQRVAD